MGMFRQMKDMKDMVNAAPAMVAKAQQLSAKAQQLSAQAQPMAAAPQPAHQAQAAQFGDAKNGDVTLEQFAAVSKGVAAYNYDQSMLPEVAANKGIAPDARDAAAQRWNERIRLNRAVAQRFNQVYRAT